MKSILMIFVLLITASAFGAVDGNTHKIMHELGTNVDDVEDSLRIILNKPANGGKFQPQEITCEKRLRAAMTLLNFEQRYPGYLQGKHGKSQWPQYNGVVALYGELSKKYDFFFPAPVSSSAHVRKSLAQ